MADGAYVFITGRRKSELDVAVKQIGRNVMAVQGDVSRLADLDRLSAVDSLRGILCAAKPKQLWVNRRSCW